MLVLVVGSFMSLSMVMLYSMAAPDVGNHIALMQAVWAVVGIVIATVISRLDYGWLQKHAWTILIVAVVLLALVLIPHIGTMRNGGRRWFNLKFALVQPSEPAKLALILALAAYGARFGRQMGQFVRGLVAPGLIAAPVLALIFVEPDRGTTILLCAVTGVMLVLAGAKLRYLVLPVVLLATVFVVSIMHDPVRMRRVHSWMHPEETKSQTGYQSWQAMLAFGSGGTTGLGLGNSRQKMGFVPEHHTDFILSIIGEEFGLVATLGVIGGFLIFMACGVRIALRARDTFGYLLASGLTFLIGFQAFINIGVVTSALPNKGLALPFISYGGSSLLCMMAVVGLLISIARHSAAEEEQDDEVSDGESFGQSRNPFRVSEAS